MKKEWPLQRCSECDSEFVPVRRSQDFCSSACAKSFNNRRMRRGAQLYDLFMVMRHDQKIGKKMGVWNLMCRMATYWKEDDQARRGKSRPWKRPQDAIEQTNWARATIVKR